ncbi:MAG: hypothetical protein HC910_01550 [Spirulinaceae cyanobacterium SM2_1_0]|nr:hypothetical protein [Spirulinaceae cyanobacterium SM2_1_0]
MDKQMPATAWYLGLDIGTAAIAATLLATDSGRLYPLYWSARTGKTAEPPTARLPAIAYFGCDTSTGSLAARRLAVGAPALKLARHTAGIWLDGMKPYLNTALPFYSRKRRQWEPQLLGYGEQPVPLFWVQRALQAMVATLTPAGRKHRYALGAKGLTGAALREILLNLQGVIVSCPAGWSDAYQFNVREAILGAGLVPHPAQIFFLAEATAALLESWHQGWVSGDRSTLVIHSGTSHTELAIARLPAQPADWSQTAVSAESLAYGSNALSLDIFSHLLYPQWQPEQSFLQELAFEPPQPGQPDSPRREEAFTALQIFPAGRSLLATAWRVALILRRQPELATHLGPQAWSVSRTALTTTIFEPLVQPVNQAVNRLLSQQGLAADAITQILFSGGLTPILLPALQPWLARKFPLASLVRASESQPGRLVARGLARLPAHPQLLDRRQHQYSDYFLLAELLTVLTDASVVTWPDIAQQLEQRGVNTRACQTRLTALLTGTLPPGLLPDPATTPRLTPDSRRCLEYRAIAAAPLSQLDAEQRYHPNHQQSRRLQQFLALALTGATQSLGEPLSADLQAIAHPEP